MENAWLRNFKRLQSIANTGLEFTQDKYDKERYHEISNIALTMLSTIADVPVNQIENLVGPKAKGYDTPKVDVRGAVFKDNKILLVQEESDGLWTLPGGYADVGLSAAENIEKEILEEAGVTVTARQLYNLRHKAKGGFDPDVREFYKLYFLCDLTGEQTLAAGVETTDARFFARDEIPPLSTGRVIEEDLQIAWEFSIHQYQQTLFD